MKTRTYTKNLHLEDTPTKELLMQAFVKYKSESFKDFVITALMTDAAKSFIKRGSLREPGSYEVSLTFFAKDVPWHKYRMSICKLD
jgi:hypothetical protein